MDKKINTTITFEFYDETTVEMTLTFYKLYRLKEKNRGLYDRYNEIMSRKQNSELDMITLLYVAYACANLDSMEKIMSEEEFMIKCGCDRLAIKNATEQLLYPKKRKASDRLSKDEQEQKKEE